MENDPSSLLPLPEGLGGGREIHLHRDRVVCGPDRGLQPIPASANTVARCIGAVVLRPVHSERELDARFLCAPKLRVKIYIQSWLIKIRPSVGMGVELSDRALITSDAEGGVRGHAPERIIEKVSTHVHPGKLASLVLANRQRSRVAGHRSGRRHEVFGLGHLHVVGGARLQAGQPRVGGEVRERQLDGGGPFGLVAGPVAKIEGVVGPGLVPCCCGGSI